ncbi:MAG: hypothetical protein ACKE51_06640 [Methylococcaceae bacterium]
MKRIRFKRVTLSLTATIIALGLNVNEAMAFNSIGKKLNIACEDAGFEPKAPYQAGDCLLCHDDDGGDLGEDGGSGEGKSAWKKDNLNFFCEAPAPVDTDGDRVIDDNDECINEVGPASNNGCPLPPAPVDTDNDGVNDDVDECIDEVGPADNNGCPLAEPEPAPAPTPADTDNDGVHDDIDECIDDTGPESNNGCPLPIPPAGDSAPVLELIPNTTLTVGEDLYIHLNAEDADGDMISLSSSGLGEFMMMKDGGTGSINGTATTPGSFDAMVAATAGVLNDFQKFNITVLPAEPEDENDFFFKATFEYDHETKRLYGKLKARPFNHKLRYDQAGRTCSRLYRHTAYTGSDANGNVIFSAAPNCEGRSIEWIAMQPDEVPCSITLTAERVVTKTFEVSGCDHDDYTDNHISAPEGDTPDDQGDSKEREEGEDDEDDK